MMKKLRKWLDEQRHIRQMHRCKRCREKTKETHGYWAGRNFFGLVITGRVYTCQNESCSIYRDRKYEYTQELLHKGEVDNLNIENGIDVTYLKHLRLSRRVLMLDMARMLNIKSSTYSGYESLREPMPISLYSKAVEILRSLP